MNENDVTGVVVDAAMKVHQALGPGLLESVYERILMYELRKRGLRVEAQIPVPIVFDGLAFDEAFRCDLLVEGKVVVELKSVEEVKNVHKKQVLTYLRLMDLRVGLLLNFGCELMKQGIHRISNGMPD
ncbi:MAG: GxxExxY protein [Phycisphaerales bacterium JB063]